MNIAGSRAAGLAYRNQDTPKLNLGQGILGHHREGRGRQPRRPPIDQCRPPLSHRCVQLLRHILLFPEQLSAQCCLQMAGSKANAGTDQTTKLSKATTETSLDIVASLW